MEKWFSREALAFWATAIAARPSVGKERQTLDYEALDSGRKAEVEEAWEEYKSTGSLEAREKLILFYVPLVKYVAGRVSVGLPSNVDFDDLVSYGIFGLVDAVEKFDRSRGVKFETYAVARIRGAVIDGLRSVDWVPRSVRQKARELEQTVAELEATLGRPATDAEVSEALSISVEAYYELLAEVKGISLASLDEVWVGDPDEESKLRYGQMIEDPVSEDPTLRVEDVEVKRVLTEAIDQLPERERLVVALYYYEGLTLKEIGEVLGVSESRVSQIHTKAIVRLRGRLGRYRQSLVS